MNRYAQRNGNNDSDNFKLKISQYPSDRFRIKQCNAIESTTNILYLSAEFATLEGWLDEFWLKGSTMYHLRNIYTNNIEHTNIQHIMEIIIRNRLKEWDRIHFAVLIVSLYGLWNPYTVGAIHPAGYSANEDWNMQL